MKQKPNPVYIALIWFTSILIVGVSVLLLIALMKLMR